MKEKRRGRKMQMRTDDADFPFPYSSRYFSAALRDARTPLPLPAETGKTGKT